MTSPNTRALELLKAASFVAPEATSQRLTLENDADPRDADLAGITAVELRFPTFSDGRAFSQAFLLRRRLGFSGDIRATGDVLIDQLVQMQRSGFSQAVLRDDQDAQRGQALLNQYPAFYQGDAVTKAPRFAQAAA